MRTSPETYYVSVVDACNYVLKCLSACGLASTEQLARVYQYRTQPVKRMQEVLRLLASRGYIESWRYAYDKPSIHRLRAKVRRKHNLKAVRWDAHIDHKLAITEVYLDLGLPDYFIREYRQAFAWQQKASHIKPDGLFKVGHRYFLVEVQRTPTEAKEWSGKRQNYERYFASGAWSETFTSKPEVLAIQYANQQESTIGVASNYTLYVISAEEVSQFGIHLRTRQDDTVCGQGSRSVEVGKGDAQERADLWR